MTEQMVGFYTIVPEYIPFKEAQGVMQIMDHQFVKHDDQVYHLLENKLDTYKYSERGRQRNAVSFTGNISSDVKVAVMEKCQ